MSDDQPVIIFAGGTPPPGNSKGKSKNQRNQSQVAVPMKGFLVILALVLIFLSLITIGLWYLTENVTHKHLRIFVLVLIYTLPVMFAFGYWFGRNEVRGFLGGMDAAIDRIADTVNVRDGAKVNLTQKIQTPPPSPHPRPGSITVLDPPHTQQHQPALPQLTFMQSGEGDVIDLS